MPIYKLEGGKIVPVQRTTFHKQGLHERRDMQALLKSRIDVLCPGTLVVAEEFGEWEDSRRRIDLLGIDKSANLVVIELKRTEDGGHMELQAIRYASMISTLTFTKLIPIYASFLAANGIEVDATESLLEFLEWSEPDEESFGQEVRIVLASAEFSKELTTSVMWLNEYGLDIQCVRMHPYTDGSQTFIDVQTVIPIPEVADYQVRIREKKQKEREARETGRDTTRYDVTVSGKTHVSQPKRRVVFYVIAGALANGASPEDVARLIPWRENRLFRVFEGELTGQQVQAQPEMAAEDANGRARYNRYFSKDGEVFHFGGKTYVLSNQWGHGTLEAVDALGAKYPRLGIGVRPTGERGGA